jgi:hypothetical protein
MTFQQKMNIGHPRLTGWTRVFARITQSLVSLYLWGGSLFTRQSLPRFCPESYSFSFVIHTYRRSWFLNGSMALRAQK